MNGRLKSIVAIVGPALAIVLALGLLLGGVAIGIYGEISYRQQKVTEVSVQADILASTVTAALVFEDRAAAREYVGALQANPQVEAAAIYDATGALFAAYARHGQRLPATAAKPEASFESSRVIVVTPVLQEGKNIGTVYLRTESEPIYRRVTRYGLLALLVTMASLLVAVLGTSRAALARANAELARRAEALGLANRTLQAEMEQRAQVEERLRQAQKMEAIGQLTGGVAHDFNNILQIIIGNLERLSRRAADLPDGGRGVSAALGAADRATKLTQQLLAFSRRQPLNPAPLDVNRLISRLADLLARTLGEMILVKTRLGHGIAPVTADVTQLESALLNLAVNARDAMPTGGRLTIETRHCELDSAFTANADVQPGAYVQISVTDTGIGMTPDVVAKAFEPFFTTKSPGRGTGLGLSQVYGFVKQSGGHVDISSAPGHGTRINLYLPEAAAEEPTRPAAAGRTPEAAASETILVVEDNPDVRAYSAAILRDLGYTVIEAAEPTTALEILRGATDVDLLFTDVGLPGLNGRELADRARQQRPKLRILFTSGYAQDLLVHGGRLDPGVELLTKPFTAAALAEKVRAVLHAPLEG